MKEISTLPHVVNEDPIDWLWFACDCAAVGRTELGPVCGEACLSPDLAEPEVLVMKLGPAKEWEGSREHQ